MNTPLQSLIESGTKLWLDSIDPDLVRLNREQGATGATSNPIIVSDLIKTGRFDDRLAALMNQGLDDEAVAWQVTDQLVRGAQEVFAPVWTETRGNVWKRFNSCMTPRGTRAASLGSSTGTLRHVDGQVAAAVGERRMGVQDRLAPVRLVHHRGELLRVRGQPIGPNQAPPATAAALTSP